MTSAMKNHDEQPKGVLLPLAGSATYSNAGKPMLRPRVVIEAEVENQAIDLRVDWDGNPASLGRLEALTTSGAWQACERIDTGPLNDVVVPRVQPAGEVFLVRFQRGPDHPECIFGVKAIPIKWISPLATHLHPDSVAKRDIDYVYADDLSPEAVPWTYSVLADGHHGVILKLAVGCDYEVRVRLQHPDNPNDWLEQDPIVRGGSDGGNPAGTE